MGKVRVRLQDGTTVEVDQSTAAALDAAGPGAHGHSESASERADRAYKTTIDKNASSVAAAVGSGVNTALAGIPGALGLIPESVKEDIEARPGAAMVGDVLSVLAPTGLLGKGAKAATEFTVMGQAAKLGRVEGSAVVKAAARAGEGAIQSAAGNLSHVTISNDPFNSEAFVADVGLGSVLNVAFGAMADRVVGSTAKSAKAAQAAVLGEDATTLVKLKQAEAKAALSELNASPEYAEARDAFNSYNTAKAAVNNRVKQANEAFARVSTPEAAAAALKKYEGVQGQIRTALKRMPIDEGVPFRTGAEAGGAVGTYDDLKAFLAQADSERAAAGSVRALDEATVEPLHAPGPRSSLAEAGFEERMPTSLEDTLVRSELGEDLTNLRAPRTPLAERIPGMQMMRAETPRVSMMRNELDEVSGLFDDSRAITSAERDQLAGRLFDGGNMSRTTDKLLYPTRVPTSADLLEEANRFASLGRGASHAGPVGLDDAARFSGFARGAEHVAPSGLDDAARFADSAYQAPNAVFGGLGEVKTATLLDAAAARRGGEFNRYAKGYRYGEPATIPANAPEQFIDDAAEAIDNVAPAEAVSAPGSTPEPQLSPRARLETLNQEIERVKAEAKRLVAEGDYRALNRLFSDTNEQVLDTLGGANLPKPVQPAPVGLVDVPPAMPRDLLKLVDMQDASIERIAKAMTPEVEQKLVQLAAKLGQEATGGGTALYGIRGHLKMTKALSKLSKVHLEAKAADLAAEAAKTGKLEWSFTDGDLSVKLTDGPGGAERLAKVSGLRRMLARGTQSTLAAAAHKAFGGLTGVFLGRMAYGTAGWMLGGESGLIAGLVFGQARAGMAARTRATITSALAGTTKKLAPLSSAMSYISVQAKHRDRRNAERPAFGSLYDTKSVRAAIDAVHVQAAAAPDTMYEFVKPLMGVTGDVAFGIASQVVDSLKYLSEVAPKDPGVNITPTGSRWEPTTDEAHEFLHRVEAVFNPLMYVTRVLAGEGHPAGVESLDARWPGIVNMCRMEAVNQMTDDLDPQVTSGLSMLMRGPVTAADDPDLFLMAQSMFASARGQMKRSTEAQASNPTGRPAAVQSPTAGSRVSELTK